MVAFFIINDEIKIRRKNKGRLLLQHYINKYKLFKKFFFCFNDFAKKTYNKVLTERK